MRGLKLALAATAFVLILVGSATAALQPWGPITITTADMRVGDIRHTSFSLADREEQVLQIEGPAQASDEWGVVQPTLSVRIDRYRDGTLAGAERCHFLKGTTEVIQAERLAGDGYGARSSGGGTNTLTGGQTQYTEEAVGVKRFDAGLLCGLDRDPFPSRTFSEGDRVTLREVSGPPDGPELLSRPARATEFQGVPALAFRFYVRDVIDDASASPDAHVDYVLADGHPGYVRAVMRNAGEELELYSLLGFVPGAGERVVLDGPSATRTPAAATFMTYDPRGVDDSAFGFEFPYQEAYQALQRDPAAALWLRDHGDAVLTYAALGPVMGPSGDPTTFPTWTWLLQFSDTQGGHGWRVTRNAPNGVPLPFLPAALPIHTVEDQGPATAFAGVPPSQIADSASMARLASAADLGQLADRFEWALWSAGDETHAEVYLTDVSQETADDSGHTVKLDPRDASIDVVYSTTYDAASTPGLLPDLSQGPTKSTARTFTLIPRPSTAASQAAAIGLLAAAWLLAKLVLVPLYTRLRRDRLLDNPVRARLFERIRADPGIHLAEIEEFLGIGKGAARHHVDQLAKHRFVFLLEEGGYTRAYVTGHVPPDVARQTALLRSGSYQRVYDLYAQRPGLPLREAARGLGMSAPSVHRAKKKLEAAGLLPVPAAAEVRRER